ncbi:MAG: carboxylesterase family protein [Myxococcales bacterium]|nr:carboxylesterase family protein [Myxococcales bacterium]
MERTMWIWMMLWGCQGEGTPGTTDPRPTIPWQTNPPPDRTEEPPPVDTGPDEPVLELVGCNPDVATSYTLPTTTACLLGRQALLVEAYLGVPYAEPPVGQRRWARPVPIEVTPVDEKIGWAVPIEAKEAGPACPQTYGTDDGGISEDSESCLTLNVFRPKDTEQGHDLPILVFLHGGGFTDGSSTQRMFVGESFANPLEEQPFPPSALKLATDAIVVTVNYRLGPLGFLAHRGLAAADPDGVTGNQGLWDALEALRWVHTNAEAMGGSADQIALFGESEGAEAACALMASPESAGLFTSVILQGGGCTAIDHGLSTPGSSEGAAFDQGDAMAEALGCADAGTDTEVVACMRDRTREQLVDTLRARRTPVRDGPRYGPVVDGRLLVEPPAVTFAKGLVNDVLVVGGANAFAGERYATRDAVTTTEELHAALQQLGINLGLPAAELQALYPPAEHDDDPQAALVAALTDTTFVCPVRDTLDALSSHTSVHAYQFQYGAPSQFDELPFVFGTLDPTHPAQDLSETIRAAWISVAMGAPTYGTLGAWPTMGPASMGGGTWVSIADEAVITLGFRQATCDALAEMAAP